MFVRFQKRYIAVNFEDQNFNLLILYQLHKAVKLFQYDTWACFETFTSATLLTNLGYPMIDLKLMVTRRQLMTLSDDETLGRE